MYKFVINGQKRLKGEVEISGSKNAALAILPATILVGGVCEIHCVPDIDDVRTMIDILVQLGASIEWISKDDLRIDTSTINSHTATYEMASKIRASCYLLGALLGSRKIAFVAPSGGCNFGVRPIDLHIKGFKLMGATHTLEHGADLLKADELRGAHIYLDMVSVGATINIMFAAVKAKGTTVIENAAKEPHIVDVANFLNSMGAKIKGAGTDIMRIVGVETLKGGYKHTIIPDQIEAGTFMIAAATTKGDVLVKNVIPTHMESLVSKFKDMGVNVEEFDDSIRVWIDKPINKAVVKTLPHPGFPTDLQPLIATLLCFAEGISTVTEGVWESRFQYVDELKRMGAKIDVNGKTAIIEGVGTLSGAPIRAHDLRAGAAMVIAGLAAEGTTEVYNVRDIDRGYQQFVEKLKALGADIERVSIKE
ncbi:MAG: UDP-N-acetylglucosamine 1-carboxyvinyltransferase [Bacillota bacterium]